MKGNAGLTGILHNLGRPQLADLLLTSCLEAVWVKSSSVFPHRVFFFFALFCMAIINLSLDCEFCIFYEPYHVV